MHLKKLSSWVLFIVFESLCIASCGVLISASRSNSVLGTHIFSSKNFAEYVTHHVGKGSSGEKYIRIRDEPGYSKNFTMIKVFIVATACVAVFVTLFTAASLVFKQIRAGSGFLLVLCALVLSAFSVVYTVHCSRIIRDPTFASEAAAFEKSFPKSYVRHVYYLLIFTWPITILFYLYAAYVLWDCYRNKLFQDIPNEDVVEYSIFPRAI
ncbi:hypothetical protein RF11_04621 [Thelohanellus kitauei]|uniref:Uncharacterized protein n=1 Tax=Thelohanellus kitauei TaxID=669202 RepID=A0A0C2MW51_THEKT|nr:hypothetical protein RF11_04621 [Thelohanellus kitauei]